MSFFDSAIRFFESLAGVHPAAQQAATDAKTAAQSAEAAVVALLDPIVDEVMAKLPFGQLVDDSILDPLLVSIANKFLAKLSPASAPVQVAHAPASMQPIAN